MPFSIIFKVVTGITLIPLFFDISLNAELQYSSSIQITAVDTRSCLKILFLRLRYISNEPCLSIWSSETFKRTAISKPKF